MCRSLLQFFATVSAFLLLISLANAQTSTARISGLITDESGGVLAGVQVTVHNVEMGVSRNFTSDERGRYSAPELVPGHYEVTATISGFETLLRSGITMTVGQEATINLSLKVGAVNQQVTVREESPMVDTSSSSVSGVVEEKRITELPLNGRDFSQLALVQPGVFSVRNTDSVVSKGFGTRISMAGSRADQTGWLLDGTNMKSIANFGTPGSAAGVMMGVDAVREFRVLTGSYSAEFGGSSGGVIQLVTKSGTNDLHGSVYEFLRNDNVDARGFFDRTKPEFRRNQFGASLGGRIRKDKAFYFGNFEGLRQATVGLTRVSVVPDENLHNGLLPGAGGSLLPVTVAPSIRPYLDLWPLPNGPSLGNGLAQVYSPATDILNENFFVARTDYYLNSNQTIFARFTLDQGDDSTPDLLPITNTKVLTHSRFATLQYERILSPRLLSTTRAAYNRVNLSGDISLNINYPKNLFFFGNDYPAIMVFPGVSSFGPVAQSVSMRIQNMYEFSENLIYSSGAHSMKFGVNIEKVGFNTGGPSAGAFGSFGWRTTTEFLQDAPLQTFSAQVVGTGTNRTLRQKVFGMYFQDDWRVHPHLTLNLGLRYEPFTTPTEKWGRVSVVKDWVTATAFDVNVPFWNNPSMKDFSPRAGFAWDPQGNGKTAIRAGFGLFYEVLLGSYYRSISIKNPPFVASIDTPQGNLASANADVLRIGPTLLTPKMTPNTFMEFHQWNLDPTYEMKFNASVEREIVKDLSVSLGYVGSRGIHLWRLTDANALQPTLLNGRPFVAARPSTPNPRPNPNTGVGTIRYTDAQSFYNAMTVELKKRVSRGFQVQSSFTWSKNVDDSTTGVALTDYNEGATSQPYNPKADRGLSSLHLGKNLIVNGIWTVPSAAQSGLLSYVLGGWQLSGIFSASSGVPFTIYISGYNAPDLTRTAARQHPDLVAGRSSSSIVSGTTAGCGTVPAGKKLGTPNLYFDPCAYVLPPPGVYGNSGRNTLIGPGFADVDFSILKTIPLRVIKEGSRLEFHGDFFNLFNRANFGPPVAANSQVLNPTSGARLGTAGLITKTVSQARQMQFGLKIIF